MFAFCKENFLNFPQTLASIDNNNDSALVKELKVVPEVDKAYIQPKNKQDSFDWNFSKVRNNLIKLNLQMTSLTVCITISGNVQAK